MEGFGARVAIGVALATAALLGGAGVAGGAASDANVAPCQKAMLGHGSADWRRESLVAGPVGVVRHPLSRMSPTANGLVAKMPILVEGQAPETVTVRVPAGLRNRVFLYYGNIVGRDGEPTTLFNEARGYGETEFQLCPGRPRTIWPGGIRVKGSRPVHLLVELEAGAAPIPLSLGRPRARPAR